MAAWLLTGLISLLTIAVLLWRWDRWQRKQDVARLVNATLAGDLAELATLLRENVDLQSVPEWFGEPALIVAVKSAKTGCKASCVPGALRLLLAHGANVNERGTEWKTALMHAAGGGHREVCEILLAHGAQPNARDAFGRTAAWWAEYAGFFQLASLLRGAGERTWPRSSA